MGERKNMSIENGGKSKKRFRSVVSRCQKQNREEK